MFGMNVRLTRYTPDGGVSLEHLNNVTEIHYSYDFLTNRSGEMHVAFESNFHNTGMTVALSEVVEFEALPQSTIAKRF